ncbi:MAG: HlyC/CorC family transporter [Alphaproteobacteria bacterium]|nr:HlyC/CorC family transporter [Alphaproteobacteria bacterium]
MTPFPWTDLVIIACLILLNGLFAMSELAIVSARAARMKMAEARGSRAARLVLEIASDPGKFLSTVQIGITLIGILAGAYSGASLGGPVGDHLAAIGLPTRYAQESGFALVIIVVTFLSVIVGELVPKQLALRAAEPIALVMVRPMALLARAMAPFVWLLDRTSAFILRVFSVSGAKEGQLTAEELHAIIYEATHSGVIEESERAIMSEVMKLAERPVRELMTPRTEIDSIDIGASEDELRERIASSPHSLLPVVDGSPDEVVGVVKVREILSLIIAGEPVSLPALVRRAAVIPDQVDALDAMRVLQTAEVAMAMVHDEYGHLDGIVTPTDLLTAIAGTFVSDQDEGDAPFIVERADGSLLVSGAMPADAMAARLGMELPEPRDFATAAGYVLAVVRQVPQEGLHFDDQGWRFEVVDMDGLRIDKLLASRIETSGEPEAIPSD